MSDHLTDWWQQKNCRLQVQDRCNKTQSTADLELSCVSFSGKPVQVISRSTTVSFSGKSVQVMSRSLGWWQQKNCRYRYKTGLKNHNQTADLEFLATVKSHYLSIYVSKHNTYQS